MPFVRTAVPRGVGPDRKRDIVQSIHDALVEAIGMPQDELFNLVTEYADGDFFFDRSFNGVTRSENLIVVEITLRRGRSDAMKRALYAAITRNLEIASPSRHGTSLSSCMKTTIRTGASAMASSP